MNTMQAVQKLRKALSWQELSIHTFPQEVLRDWESKLTEFPEEAHAALMLNASVRWVLVVTTEDGGIALFRQK